MTFHLYLFIFIIWSHPSIDLMQGLLRHIIMNLVFTLVSMPLTIKLSPTSSVSMCLFMFSIDNTVYVCLENCKQSWVNVVTMFFIFLVTWTTVRSLRFQKTTWTREQSRSDLNVLSCSRFWVKVAMERWDEYFYSPCFIRLQPHVSEADFYTYKVYWCILNCGKEHVIFGDLGLN